jgi:hypothetical protein
LAKGHVIREHTEAGLEITAPLISAEGVLGAITLCEVEGDQVHWRFTKRGVELGFGYLAHGFTPQCG